VRGWLTGDPVSIWDGLLCLIAAAFVAVGAYKIMK
jgi:hypothetical protein